MLRLQLLPKQPAKEAGESTENEEEVIADEEEVIVKDEKNTEEGE